jgi:hypothetical protein
MKTADELFVSDTGWIVTGRGSCYSRSKRKVVVRLGVSLQEVKDYAQEEKNTWFGQEFYAFYDRFPEVDMERAVDSSG